MFKIIFFISAIIFATPVKAEIAAFFSPTGDCEKLVVDQIDNAKQSIDIAVYAITSKTITKALKRAMERDIDIRFITDKSQAEFRLSTVRDLHSLGLNIRVNSAHRLQHNKYAIFDGANLVTGSNNWTYSGGNKNSENCLLITNEPNVVAKYEKDFNHLWKINSKNESDKWFDKNIK